MNCPSGDQQSGLNLKAPLCVAQHDDDEFRTHAGDVESRAVLIRDTTSSLWDHSHLSSSFSFHRHPPWNSQSPLSAAAAIFGRLDSFSVISQIKNKLDENTSLGISSCLAVELLFTSPTFYCQAMFGHFFQRTFIPVLIHPTSFHSACLCATPRFSCDACTC